MKIGEKVKKIAGTEGEPNGRRRIILIGATLVVVVIVVALSTGVLGAAGPSGDVISIVAQRRPLAALVVERGTLRAASTVAYNAPRMRRGGSQLILELAPEGEVVEPGDLVVRFDAAALEEQIRRMENDLEEEEMNLRKTIAQQESQMASLQAEYEMAQHDHEQADLRIRSLTFESAIRRQQEDYNFKKSELRLQRAWEAIDTRQRINEAALAQQRMGVERSRDELEAARAELALTTLYAEQPGLVIYEKTFGSDGEAKIKVGDSPFSGQAVVSIPDLTTMMVQIGISELDINKVSIGQRALMHVDAYPDTVYSARVTEVSPLAHRQGRSQMKVFDCRIEINGTDLKLRPGMTATVSIITAYTPDALVVPLEAVFRKEDKTIVFTLDGGVEEREVTLGANDGSFVAITAGLEAGVRVALRDPYIKLEQIESAGADALLQTRSVSSSRGMSPMFIGLRGGGLGGLGGGGGRGGEMSVRIFR